jgi:ubiquinone/menaquinone biosynthesis C-methylase UbiE
MQNKLEEIKFFDNFVHENAYDVFDKRGYERIISELIKVVDTKKTLRVLDMGCGTGAFTSKMMSFDFDIQGVDISPESIKLAKELYPDIIFTIGDIENLSFLDDESFDLITLSGVLHHFENITNVVSECYRLLKKDAILFAYDPNRYNPVMWLYRCKSSPFYSSKGVTPNEEPISKDSIISVFSNFNFNELNVFSISGVTFKYIESQYARLLLPFYNFIEIVFDLPFLRKKLGSFIITTVKK